MLQVRAEVAAEREASLTEVHSATEALTQAQTQLQVEKQAFEEYQAQQKLEIEQAWKDLREAQEVSDRHM